MSQQFHEHTLLSCILLWFVLERDREWVGRNSPLCLVDTTSSTVSTLILSQTSLRYTYRASSSRNPETQQNFNSSIQRIQLSWIQASSARDTMFKMTVLHLNVCSRNYQQILFFIIWRQIFVLVIFLLLFIYIQIYVLLDWQQNKTKKCCLHIKEYYFMKYAI